MYKLIIKAANTGTLLLTGIGNEEHSVRESAENWINTHEVNRNEIIVEVTPWGEQIQDSITKQENKKF